MTTSIQSIWNSAIAQIPEGKKSFGYKLVIIPFLNAEKKSNSSNGAKTITGSGSYLTQLGAKDGVSRGAFMSSMNVAFINEGKLYKRSTDQIQINFKLSALTQSLVYGCVKELASEEELKDLETTKQMIEFLGNYACKHRGQFHLLCLDVNQGEIKTPTFKGADYGEHETFIVHSKDALKLSFVVETSNEYIHRVDMPTHLNSRNLGEEVQDTDQPKIVDALAPRALSRKKVIKLMNEFLQSHPEKAATLSIEEIEVLVGSTMKEVKNMTLAYRESLQQTSAVEAGLETEVSSEKEEDLLGLSAIQKGLVESLLEESQF